jgi:hypothetical protein
MAGTNDETATTRKTTRRNSSARARKTAAARRRQRWAAGRAGIGGNGTGGTVAGGMAYASQIVDALEGTGFMKPLNPARKRHATNLVNIALRGSK